MVVTIQTAKETAKTEARVETVTAKTGIAAGERETSADRTETGDKTETKVTCIKKETQATIREATKSGTIVILEPRIRK
jgi:hypothetical protein